MVYYREANGDFLAIDAATNGYYRRCFGQDHFEGRAAAVAGQAGSVCTTAVSREYLRACCERVAKDSVPAAWQRAFGFTEDAA